MVRLALARVSLDCLMVNEMMLRCLRSVAQRRGDSGLGRHRVPIYKRTVSS